MKEQVAEIVSAYVSRNKLDAAQLPTLITKISQSLAALGQPVVVFPTPAVPIARSVGAKTITCLDCGRQSKLIKRHLLTAHNLTPDQYRERWKLPRDYPMVAKNYSARRSQLAKSLGLGRR